MDEAAQARKLHVPWKHFESGGKRHWTEAWEHKLLHTFDIMTIFVLRTVALISHMSEITVNSQLLSLHTRCWNQTSIRRHGMPGSHPDCRLQDLLHPRD